MRDGYDVAQVCLRGYVINTEFRSMPWKNRKHCPDCGAKTITNCQECNEEITGESTAPSPFVTNYTDPAPNYRTQCGKLYPWTQGRSKYSGSWWVRHLWSKTVKKSCRTAFFTGANNFTAHNYRKCYKG
ncbi:MAG: DUF2321 domain-containing protein [Cenarchaeum sp. SB0663_bin_5]|nr:DUF2321 domain-containing protein [Cenarchaeum sp. SB0663_bin_5]MYH04777.1 DUF2321 domain-containing protein [Cenarchaeum sp. SB0675_bin_21]MYL10863.1 DUF2321 domain-containing protein [Cenarchaeum sp. SB0669_bin_11]